VGSIIAFSFLKSANQIPVDASAIITGSNITIFLPPGTAKTNLVSSYQLSDSGTVTVNNVGQKNNVTQNDFTAPVTYHVTNKSGATQAFTVTLITDMQTIDENVAVFMQRYKVPALSIAISKQGKLVYAKSYGFADVENQQPATNQNLFRLASCSKQFTSVAVMRLLDQGKIHLTDKVFGPNSIFGTTYGTQPYYPRLEQITISDLLHHTCGGWSNDDDSLPDPMFTNPSMSAQQLISWTLDNIKLEYDPGFHYDYSNFGYCILGRIIEKITGQPYDAAVQSLVLDPCGISDMRIGGNTLAQRYPNEVKYYGQNGEDPYIYNITRMDSHGGWIATATDMVKFLGHVDGSDRSIISPQALNIMTAGSTANTGYGCGWILTGHNYWHNGSLPGTQTEQAIIKDNGTYNFAIIVNTRNNADNFGSDMDNVFWNSVSETMLWPTYDLFQQ